MHIGKRRADLFQRLWHELLRRAAEAGRVELLSKLPSLVEARGVSDSQDLAVETAGAIDTVVRWWP
jgi:hypothetical protein